MITDIIPSKPTYYNTTNNELVDFSFSSDNVIDFESICFFAAIGFFIDDSTYYKNLRVVKPASKVELKENKIIEQTKRWEWHYSPRDISFEQAVDEFTELFESITKEQLSGQKVILPLSGGIDSRSQAAALIDFQNVQAYSYKFPGGIDENKYGKAIAGLLGFPFREFSISNGYLWDVIDELADINHCLSEFTHPRQMAVRKELTDMGDVFFLGHWGDVLFDDMGVNDTIDGDEQVEVLYKKIIKKGGEELAGALWETFGLKGDFKSALTGKLRSLFEQVKIENANAKVRAFKSMYWAPRWTSSNFGIWETLKPIKLPYYHDDMCKFICTVPEKHLAARKIQIQYIKNKSEKLATIPWQTYDPLNLYNFEKYNSFGYLPVRVLNKLKREINYRLLNKRPKILRNWELQFLGEENDKKLKSYLFDNKNFVNFIPEKVIENFYNKFKTEDPVKYSHTVSTLLTLSLFSKKHFGQ